MTMFILYFSDNQTGNGLKVGSLNGKNSVNQNKVGLQILNRSRNRFFQKSI